LDKLIHCRQIVLSCSFGLLDRYAFSYLLLNRPIFQPNERRLNTK
jgi:hypothetical protein